MLGGGPYQVSDCPICGSLMWNGVCENQDCYFHWHPLDDGDDENNEA